MLILILTVRFKFRMLWLLALTCQCISHFSLVNGPQGNREMPNKLMIGPDQSLLFNFRRNHLRTRPPAQSKYLLSECLKILKGNSTQQIKLCKYVKFRYCEKATKFESSIVQTFRKTHSCTDFLFFEFETSNFGYLLISQFSVNKLILDIL